MSRASKRAIALSKPGVGQAVPGALSAAKTGTYSSSVAFKPSTSPNPFVTVGGKSGQLAQSTPPPVLGMSDAFAAKARQDQELQALKQGQGFNTTNPFAPGFTGVAPDKFGDLKTGVQSIQSMPDKFSDLRSGLYDVSSLKQVDQVGARAAMPDVSSLDKLSHKLINTVLDGIESLGGGDFGRGIMQIISLPLTLGPSMVSSAGARMSLLTGPKQQLLLAAPKQLLLSAPKQLSLSAPKQLLLSAPKQQLLLTYTPGLIQPQITYTPASMLSRVTAKTMLTAKTLVAKLFTKQVIEKYIVGGRIMHRYATASRFTANQAMAAIGAVGTLVMLGTYMKLSGLNSKATGMWATKQEGPGLAGMWAYWFYKDGNRELGDLAMDMGVEITQTAISAMPGGQGSMQGSNAYADFFTFWAPLIKKHEAWKEEQALLGNTPEQNRDFWVNYKKDVLAMESEAKRADIDYFNKQKIFVDQQLLNTRSIHDANERSIVSQFWLDHKKKLLALEEEERQAIAEFWLNYKKLVFEMEKMQRLESAWNSGGQGLGFGLFR